MAPQNGPSGTAQRRSVLHRDDGGDRWRRRDRKADEALALAAEYRAHTSAGSAAGALDRIADALPEHQQRQLRSQLADVLRAVVYQRLLPARDGGRVPALEIVPVTPAIGNLIREGKTFQIPQLVQMGREAGMVPFARSVEELVRAGLVAREAAGRWAAS